MAKINSKQKGARFERSLASNNSTSLNEKSQPHYTDLLRHRETRVEML